MLRKYRANSGAAGIYGIRIPLKNLLKSSIIWLMKKKKTYKRLKSDLDKVFSLFIRTRDGGMCITCGIVKPIKEMQCGHFFSRAYLNTRWNEQNNHCQCSSCNVFRHGNMGVYAVKMVEKYGESGLNALYAQSRISIKLSRADLEEKIAHYRTTLEELKIPLDI